MKISMVKNCNILLGSVTKILFDKMTKTYKNHSAWPKKVTIFRKKKSFGFAFYKHFVFGRKKVIWLREKLVIEFFYYPRFRFFLSILGSKVSLDYKTEQVKSSGELLLFFVIFFPYFEAIFEFVNQQVWTSLKRPGWILVWN